MKWRIWQVKLLLILAIRKVKDGTLAGEMFEQQVEKGWQGLVEEATAINKELQISDVCREEVTKKDIKDAIKIHPHAALKKEMMTKEKFQELLKTDLRIPQPYLTINCLAEVRMGARVQLTMHWMKDNFVYGQI